MSASTPASNAGAPGSSVGEIRHRKLLLVAIMAISVCQMLDATIANVALPHMKTALGASNDTISWALTSFIITGAVATPATGWISDRIGSRNLFLASCILFLASSALCGAATSLVQMVIFRGIQGLAAAFIMPMTQTIMFDVSPPGKQAATMSLFSMVVMIAPIAGPTLGGFLTEYLNWRWVFYVNLPIGLPALAVLWFLLPSRPIDRRKLDVWGFFIVAIGLIALQLMLDRGQHKDWLESREIVIEAIVALSALWIFLIHTLSTPEPLFRKEIFANPTFVISMAFMIVVGFSVIGLSSILPTMFQSIYGMPIMDTGMMMAPRGIGVAITSLGAVWLMKHLDFRWVMCLGYLVAAYGMWMMTGWSIDMGNGPILWAVFVQGLGMGMIFPPMQLAAFEALDARFRPDGASMLTLFRNIGGSIGISVIVTLQARNLQVSHSDIASHVTQSSIPGFDWTGAIDRMQGMGSAATAMIDAEVNRQALMIAYLDNFWWLSWLLLFCAPLPFLMRKSGKPVLGVETHSLAMD